MPRMITKIDRTKTDVLPEMVPVVEFLRRWIDTHYATQSAAAMACGMSPQQLNNKLRGNEAMTVPTLMRLCSGLGIESIPVL